MGAGSRKPRANRCFASGEGLVPLNCDQGGLETRPYLHLVPYWGTIVPKMSTLTENSNPSATLFGKTRRAVLSLLYGRTDEAFYIRYILRVANAGHGAVQRELKQLTDAGIICRTVQGRQRQTRPRGGEHELHGHDASQDLRRLAQFLLCASAVVGVARHTQPAEIRFGLERWVEAPGRAFLLQLMVADLESPQVRRSTSSAAGTA